MCVCRNLACFQKPLPIVLCLLFPKYLIQTKLVKPVFPNDLLKVLCVLLILADTSLFCFCFNITSLKPQKVLILNVAPATLCHNKRRLYCRLWKIYIKSELQQRNMPKLFVIFIILHHTSI